MADNQVLSNDSTATVLLETLKPPPAKSRKLLSDIWDFVRPLDGVSGFTHLCGFATEAGKECCTNLKLYKNRTSWSTTVAQAISTSAVLLVRLPRQQQRARIPTASRRQWQCLWLSNLAPFSLSQRSRPS